MRALVEFGDDRKMVGILSGGDGAPANPTLILPSAGLQPRCGPFRLHVELAERLAARGMRSFRFDVPGVGEAARSNGFDDQAATLAAMDILQAQYGCSRFVVGGICSAADVGWNAAVDDDRVCAVLLLDGISFTGPWFHYARTLDRLRRLPGGWRRMLRSAARNRSDQRMTSADFRNWPSHADTRAQFAQLVARDTDLLWVFTGGYKDRFLHRRQFGWAYGAPTRSPRTEMHYWPDCDHTFYARTHRDRLLAVVEDWMVRVRERLGEKQ